MHQNKKIIQLAVMGVLISLNIIFERVLTLDFEQNRFNLSFVTYALTGMCLGPWKAAIVCGISEALGAFWKFGSIIPGISFVAMLRGVIFGIFLHRNCTKQRICFSAVLDQFFCSMILVSVALFLALGTPINAITMLPRFLQAAVIFTLEILVLPLLEERFFPYLRGFLRKNGLMTIENSPKTLTPNISIQTTPNNTDFNMSDESEERNE